MTYYIFNFIGCEQYLYKCVHLQFRSGVVYVLNATTKEWEVDVYPNQDRRTAEAAKEFGVSVGNAQLVILLPFSLEISISVLNYYPLLTCL